MNLIRIIPAEGANMTQNSLNPEITKPFPASRKIYVPGMQAGVRVAMREISQTPTRNVANQPIRVYDTSGPYTDPEATIDLQQGLAPLRRPWINARGRGANVSQMHYARHGMITPEMEYIAIRENLGRGLSSESGDAPHAQG